MVYYVITMFFPVEQCVHKCSIYPKTTPTETVNTEALSLLLIQGKGNISPAVLLYQGYIVMLYFMAKAPFSHLHFSTQVKYTVIRGGAQDARNKGVNFFC